MNAVLMPLDHLFKPQIDKLGGQSGQLSKRIQKVTTLLPGGWGTGVGAGVGGGGGMGGG